MEGTPLTAEDRSLVEQVTETNTRTYDPAFFDGAHIVTAGVRTNGGTVYEGSSLPASVGRASVCAEPVAIGAAIADGHPHDELETCVAVSYPMADHDASDQRVIPPCGVCRAKIPRIFVRQYQGIRYDPKAYQVRSQTFDRDGDRQNRPGVLRVVHRATSRRAS